MRAESSIVQARVSELKKRTFDDLMQLPPYSCKQIKDDKRTVFLAVWKEVLNAHRIRVVVQGYRYWLLGIGSMEAKGFDIYSDGTFRELARKELYDFT